MNNIKMTAEFNTDSDGLTMLIVSVKTPNHLRYFAAQYAFGWFVGRVMRLIT